ncbi:MAG: molybdate ABC transporter substrate-binding protein [Granulosicoccus sp.]
MRIQQFIVLVLFVLCANAPVRAESGLVVAAASSLRGLWPALMQSYTDHSGAPAPRVSFGSSGLLSTQILNGAPFHIFLSADLASVKRLPSGMLREAPQIFAHGELSVVVPKSSVLTGSLSNDSLAETILKDAESDGLRIAIPNPIHAPYGKAAREALMFARIWPMAAGQLLSAENASQTMQFVKSGVVAAAVVPTVLLAGQSVGFASVKLPPESYQPIEHVLAILQTAGASADNFAHWLMGEDARNLLEDSGLRVSVQ